MTVHEAICSAEAILPGQVAPEGETDPRWQAIIAIGEFIGTEPEAVWAFVSRWGCSEDKDLRMAVATCLLEHLLDGHFELVFPKVKDLARSQPLFIYTLSMCWKFGQAKLPSNAARIDRLLAETAS